MQSTTEYNTPETLPGTRPAPKKASTLPENDPTPKKAKEKHEDDEKGKKPHNVSSDIYSNVSSVDELYDDITRESPDKELCAYRKKMTPRRETTNNQTEEG